MRSGRNQYGMTWGQPSLRAAIAKKSRRFYGQEIDPDKHVTVTCGVTEAVIAALLGIVNPGEKVVVLEPAHENYHAGIAFAGGIPLWFRCVHLTIALTLKNWPAHFNRSPRPCSSILRTIRLEGCSPSRNSRSSGTFA